MTSIINVLDWTPCRLYPEQCSRYDGPPFSVPVTKAHSVVHFAAIFLGNLSRPCNLLVLLSAPVVRRFELAATVPRDSYSSQVTTTLLLPTALFDDMTNKNLSHTSMEVIQRIEFFRTELHLITVNKIASFNYFTLFLLWVPYLLTVAALPFVVYDNFCRVGCTSLTPKVAITFEDFWRQRDEYCFSLKKIIDEDVCYYYCFYYY